MKNKKIHSVPLPRQALAIIEMAPRISEEFVFSYGTRPMRGLHRAKHALDRASNVTAWTLHDLRRTCASGLARLGVSIAVIEQILNYRGGSLAGVAGVYIRHQFEKENARRCSSGPIMLRSWYEAIIEIEDVTDKKACVLAI